MNESTNRDASVASKLTPWLLGALATIFLGVIFFSGLAYMVSEWSQEEYSHGWLIPAIALFIAYRHRRELFKERWNGAWLGTGAVVLGLLLFIMGELSALYVIVQYAFLLTLSGVILSWTGWRGLALLIIPLIYLIFMIPLPDFLYNNLSAKLQLISSQLGVAVIRAFGISVYLEGNVIDLGLYQLQVVEACSGLRYLFPLMSFGFLCAYLYRGPFWQRAIVFLTTIPLTVLMNSFRIGVIGVLVNQWGIAQAEGFLHFFEGWVIFMACVALLFLEIVLLMKLTGDKRSLSEAFNVDSGEELEDRAALFDRSTPKPFVVSVVLLGLAMVGSFYLQERRELVPERPQFVDYQLEFDKWEGRELPVEQNVLNTLKLSDYLSAQFTEQRGIAPIDLWVAYYDTQRKGVSIHSPRTCLPGGGWKIDKLENHAVTEVPGADGPIHVNRAVMSAGEQRLLFYYWFKQRDRNLTNEYLVKWYLFWDSLTRKRTDGALIRIGVPYKATGDASSADERLTQFMRDIYPRLVDYVPD